MTFLQSAALCELVREFFKTGHKSGNKQYDVLDIFARFGLDDRPDLEKKQKAREEAANKSREYRRQKWSVSKPSGWTDHADGEI